MKRRPAFFWWDDAVAAAAALCVVSGIKRRVYWCPKRQKWVIGTAMLRAVRQEVPC